MGLNFILRIVTNENHAEIEHIFEPLYIYRDEKILGDYYDSIIW